MVTDLVKPNVTMSVIVLLSKNGVCPKDNELSSQQCVFWVVW
jgi:hypothetical protein